MAAERACCDPTLAALLRGFVPVPPALDRPITGLAEDSRRARAGDLFIARPGRRTHGERHVGEAIAAGAVGVLCEGTQARVERVPGGARGAAILRVTVPDLAACVGEMAHRFFDCPSERLRVVGVTGTNGKTSVTHFLAEALHDRAGPDCGRPLPCGLVGTLGTGVWGDLGPGLHTTPGTVALHEALARARAMGARHAAMEVSSHGLDQGRVAGVRFECAVLTNLTREHLDYHGDMAAYAQAKRRLFRTPALRAAIVNVGDGFGRTLIGEIDAPVERVGYRLVTRRRRARDLGDASVPVLTGRVVAMRDDGFVLKAESPWGSGEIATGLLGRFNGANLLAALATLCCLGVPFDRALARLARVSPVPGRMQQLGGGDGEPRVVVDYAHTPDALRNALESLREHCRGALWCVFGCGGERDRGKRPEMGRIAARCADGVVLTDDNPRGEPGRQIIADILEAFEDPARVIVERDRSRAIRRAVNAAGSGDVVLVAGKGHEPYQEIAGVRRPFSDADAVRAALAVRES